MCIQLQAADLLSSFSEFPEKPLLKKKEKQQLKHELFLQRKSLLA